jgi:hypothetical protein
MKRNKTLSLLIGFILVFLTQNCATQVTKTKAMDTVSENIQEVYFESWVSGVRGGGSGINFHVNFKTPLSDDIQLQKVVFKGKEAVFSTQDSLHYTANIITKTGGRSNVDEEQSSEPLPESNDAKLYFIVKGQSVVHTLENVKEKEMLAYPSMNKPR